MVVALAVGRRLRNSPRNNLVWPASQCGLGSSRHRGCEHRPASCRCWAKMKGRDREPALDRRRYLRHCARIRRVGDPVVTTGTSPAPQQTRLAVTFPARSAAGTFEVDAGTQGARLVFCKSTTTDCPPCSSRASHTSGLKPTRSAWFQKFRTGGREIDHLHVVAARETAAKNGGPRAMPPAQGGRPQRCRA